MGSKKALLIIDVQNDFCPGGALPVPKGNKVVTVLNKYIRLFKKQKLPILATRDWHPRKSRHFKGFGGEWPPHCVRNTRGARFHPRLKLPRNAVILSGGEPLTEAEFSLEIDNAPIDNSSGARNADEGLVGTEKEMILKALEKAGNNKTKAAEILKISRRRLYSRMKVHDIKP